MENTNKSIIYGNTYQNRYGRFLPICSSINDRTNVNSILQYLHDSVHFKKYNRIAYAYRVEEVPIVFITEKKNVQLQYYEYCHSDQTIEGSGEKLLHLLEKFNVKNVFIAVFIQQFNPLLPFETTNYRAIVQNSRLLLDQLYKKVINLQQKYENKSMNDLLLHDTKTIKLKKCNISEEIQMPKTQQKKNTVKERPNHIYTSGKPLFLSTKKTAESNTYQIKFMWQRCKVMRQQFNELLQSIQDKQIDQLRYFVMYDKNPLINNVVKLFTIYEGISKQKLMNQYKFEQIKKMTFEVIEKGKLTKLQDMLKSNRKLNVDSILKINRAMGILFSLIDIKIKFSKLMKRVTELMQKNQAKKQLNTQPQVVEFSSNQSGNIKMNNQNSQIEPSQADRIHNNNSSSKIDNKFSSASLSKFSKSKKQINQVQ